MFQAAAAAFLVYRWGRVHGMHQKLIWRWNLYKLLFQGEYQAQIPVPVVGNEMFIPLPFSKSEHEKFL